MVEIERSYYGHDVEELEGAAPATAMHASSTLAGS
jgi:hypothetical protein